ncbi:tRNA (adenosine(37)-N6)-threonylcarbamoyltransferase complex ATPase subunit type 1 TsaE [Peptostreptococcus anaerobius]|uniref:tRNA (adenosine(37)-N6)-threonylcarbamoyltransferase complex ATPase subunit type 1 TsaE n=1 Tax=Peptostreptococcus anaerobius TaxID=1261 RepID=UPI00232AEF76|nr:tRNA (adenosine(37)-N6)-threonylcarbamoyltransferase complex ATPase subunit type 1 TsaE [Peptostreptococcus anaerobius]MDB8850181.1 tRNA (adenosine(37)-N6)-threonylcarbamoyltransferase complex ATPase subunit type 1 TsaE [Peptostreptococcus anaerobius]MDB8853883.1 tRNA (adenosine(37)-N6)-threonylcarbamoyltransferase complex ATPase subunit type 1 TsaE [Peptostreptococcus anaerobius]MDB8855744.1 tRNA (adenosine(37)-N6)-threonylcarbamoyltransferase complex ATPase subunit type 1 TsaE [Peptostrepto
MEKIYLADESFTYDMGQKIGRALFSGAIICLNGDLGAGKTAMTKSIAKALGIDEDITSPTFTIVNEYRDGRLKLNHFDVYRIGSSDEMYDIGFDEYINSDGVSIIEWSTIIEDILPEERLDIDLNYEGMGRTIEFIPHGEKYEKLVGEVVGQ